MISVIYSGVTSTEDTSFFAYSEDGGLLEELCETLLLTVVMVLWKGIAGSDDEAWMVGSFTENFLCLSHFSFPDSWTNLFSLPLPSS